MQNYIDHALESFKPVFSRSGSWLLFCAVVMGFMDAGEILLSRPKLGCPWDFNRDYRSLFLLSVTITDPSGIRSFGVNVRA